MLPQSGVNGTHDSPTLFHDQRQMNTRESKPAQPKKAKARPVKLLTGGNPQIAKGDGDELDESQLTAWLQQAARLPGWASFSA